MFNIHLYGGEEKQSLIGQIKNRFETIYKSISWVEHRINEDDVLFYTLRVHFNNLEEKNALDKINRSLAEKNPISFIEDFTLSLEKSFEHLKTFFGEDCREHLEIHSLVTLGGIGIAIPFILKAYKFGLSSSQINQLCHKLESMVLRNRLIGTRAELARRLKDVYEKFTSDNKAIQPIADRIDYMKSAPSTDWWSAYWNNEALERALQGKIDSAPARYLLWKYENHLGSLEKSDYESKRFDEIVPGGDNPALEHIAPKKLEKENLTSGYDIYDEEFEQQYMECLGNYLLTSQSHNSSIGNGPFQKKRDSYTHLAQQREIQRMTADENPTWTKELIQARKEKIVDFIMKEI